MVSEVRQKTANTANDCQPLPVGYDGGNSSAKLIVNNAEIRVPSYFLPVYGQLHDVPESIEGGLVEYVSGDRSDLTGHRWLAGMPAYRRKPLECLRVVDEPKGKLKYGLQTFLGGMATMRHQPRWDLLVVASIQDAQIYGAELKQVLQGSHWVKFNDCVEPTQINVTISNVVEEGVGAIIQARPIINVSGQTLLYDFGYGTCIISLFGAKGKLLDRKVSPGGVVNLVEAIAKNIEVRKRLDGEGDHQLIRQGIENGSFLYGNPNRPASWNFESIYKAELMPWVQSVLSPAKKMGAPWAIDCDAIIACGGGSQLPYIDQLLRRADIAPLNEGTWANARGMAWAANMKLRGAK